MGADMIIPATNNALFRTYPEGAVAAPYGTFVKDLDKSEDVLWNEMHADFRHNIRKAKKNGVQIKTGMEYLDISYNLIAGTLERSDRKSTRLNSSHLVISYAVFCLKKKKKGQLLNGDTRASAPSAVGIFSKQ